MIEVSGVVKRYKGFELDCSIKVDNGMISGLIGANGAGKSTLFRSILGLVYPDSGEIRIFNKNVQDINNKDREKIGTVMSDAGFSGYLMIKDIREILKGFYPEFNEKFFSDKCKEFALDENKKVKELSTGMKAKLNVLCALSHRPKLLILDEPTAGLDVMARDEILTMLREFMEEDPDRSILISSHISSDLESLCDDFYMIDEGRILLHEEGDRLNENYGILKVSEEEYEKLDKAYLLKKKKEPFGYVCLTDERSFYTENYPQIVVEKSGIDHLIQLMVKGENI
ncbi:MAG: ABC transporter ATP-binding protein [Erysipelotrichaceae bacterium]|nr:ABC transporter ATP-binding protein [Erysipelotrichaceae bacterium]